MENSPTKWEGRKKGIDGEIGLRNFSFFKVASGQ